VRRARILFEIPRLKRPVGLATSFEGGLTPDPAQQFAECLARDPSGQALAGRVQQAISDLQRRAVEDAESRDDQETAAPLLETLPLSQAEVDVAREILERWVGPRSDLVSLHRVLAAIKWSDENPRVESDLGSDRP
jgi:hypothetical protein